MPIGCGKFWFQFFILQNRWQCWLVCVSQCCIGSFGSIGCVGVAIGDVCVETTRSRTRHQLARLRTGRRTHHHRRSNTASNAVVRHFANCALFAVGRRQSEAVEHADRVLFRDVHRPQSARVAVCLFAERSCGVQREVCCCWSTLLFTIEMLNVCVCVCSLDGTVRAFDLVRYRNFRVMVPPTTSPAQFSCMAVDPSGTCCTHIFVAVNAHSNVRCCRRHCVRRRHWFLRHLCVGCPNRQNHWRVMRSQVCVCLKMC